MACNAPQNSERQQNELNIVLSTGQAVPDKQSIMSPTDLPPSVRLVELSPGFSVLEIDHPTVTAKVALHGAHVMEWEPRGAMPVLYMSPESLLEHGKPIRGGIPLCWPWFGPRADAPQLPGHGLARLNTWTLESATEDTESVHLQLTLTDSAETLQLWPHAFHLVMNIQLSSKLSVALTMEHRGQESADFTSALHTYLNVGAIEQTRVLGLENATHLDSLNAHQRMPAHGVITFDQEVDRIYESTATVTVEDLAWKRAIIVSKAGSTATVVWNPWIEKSKRLSDLPDEAYHGFLCIEAANAGTDIIRLAPGESHTLATTLEILPLSHNAV
jgi:glucose-6-phosphate 1-epimerase